MIVQTKVHTGVGLNDDNVLKMYHFMALSRAISTKGWVLDRQGRVLFTMPCDGQEGADVGSAPVACVLAGTTSVYGR